MRRNSLSNIVNRIKGIIFVSILQCLNVLRQPLKSSATSAPWPHRRNSRDLARSSRAPQPPAASARISPHSRGEDKRNKIASGGPVQNNLDALTWTFPQSSSFWPPIDMESHLHHQSCCRTLGSCCVCWQLGSSRCPGTALSPRSSFVSFVKKFSGSWRPS